MTQRILVVALAAVLIGGVADRAGAEGRVERNVVFGMYSGLALLMDVYHPENPNGYGIVFISGSGWTRELGLDATPLKESGQEEIYAVPLAAAGYTVFGINHRASPRFRHPAHLEDAQRAVRFVRHHASEFGIDPERIGAMGGSSGGHLASLLGVLDDKGSADDASPVNRESAKVQVVVARAAPTDLTLAAPGRVHPLFGFRRSARTDSVEHRRFVAASPVTHVTPGDPPMLLIHGDADNVVSYENAEVMQAALEKAGVPVELLRVPGAGHGPTFPGAVNPPDYIGAMIEWLNRPLRRRDDGIQDDHEGSRGRAWRGTCERARRRLEQSLVGVRQMRGPISARSLPGRAADRTPAGWGRGRGTSCRRPRTG